MPLITKTTKMINPFALLLTRLHQQERKALDVHIRNIRSRITTATGRKWRAEDVMRSIREEA